MRVAGNDANFSFPALLMLSIKDLDATECSEVQLAALSAFQAVAKFPRPRSTVKTKTKPHKK